MAERGKRMNLSTKCNCCVKEDVCGLKGDYDMYRKAILEASFCPPGFGGAVATVKDCKSFSVKIHCDKFVPHRLSETRTVHKEEE